MYWWLNEIVYVKRLAQFNPELAFKKIAGGHILWP